MDSIECSAEPNSNETKGDAFYWNFTFDLTFKFRRSMLKVHNLLVHESKIKIFLLFSTS